MRARGSMCCSAQAKGDPGIAVAGSWQYQDGPSTHLVAACSAAAPCVPAGAPAPGRR